MTSRNGDLRCRRADRSGVGALRELSGRRAGLLTLPDGRVINNIYWNHLFKEFPEVRQFQVVLKTSGEIWIHLAGEGMTETRDAALRAKLGHLMAAIPVKLLWTAEIPAVRKASWCR